MQLHKYTVDGSSLSASDRQALIRLLDRIAYTGTIYVDIKQGLYQAMFEEDMDISAIPFPPGTVLRRIYQ